MTSAPFLLAWKGPEACLKVSGPLLFTSAASLVFEHPLDVVSPGSGAGLIQTDSHLVGGLADVFKVPDALTTFVQTVRS